MKRRFPPIECKQRKCCQNFQWQKSRLREEKKTIWPSARVDPQPARVDPQAMHRKWAFWMKPRVDPHIPGSTLSQKHRNKGFLEFSPGSTPRIPGSTLRPFRPGKLSQGRPSHPRVDPQCSCALFAFLLCFLLRLLSAPSVLIIP